MGTFTVLIAIYVIDKCLGDKRYESRDHMSLLTDGVTRLIEAAISATDGGKAAGALGTNAGNTLLDRLLSFICSLSLLENDCECLIAVLC